tara:strand:- start:958 stop:1431 length:474 start_codon:yes stop_codon:yes gene_type:complete
MPDVPNPHYFEDFKPGLCFETGEKWISSEEIISFAREYDPQPIHTDEAYAVKTPFNGVIGSGIHMMGISMALAANTVLKGSAAVASPGAEKLRFMAPLRAGTTVRGRLRIIDSKPSKTRTDRGNVSMSFELFDGDTQLLEWVAIGIFMRDPARAPAN